MSNGKKKPVDENPYNIGKDEEVISDVSTITLYESANDKIDLTQVMNNMKGNHDNDSQSDKIKKIMRIIINNTSADQYMYLCEKNDKWDVTVSGVVQGKELVETVFNQNSDEPIILPKTIIRYVARSAEPLVLADVMVDDNIEVDDYIRQFKPASVLCFPVTTGDEIEGIIYLENKKIKNAFTEEHLKILEMLVPIQIMWSRKPGDNNII